MCVMLCVGLSCIYVYGAEADSSSGALEKLKGEYAYQEKIWEDSYDMNADNENEQVSVYAVSNENGYASIIVYIDENEVFSMQTEQSPNKADICICPKDTWKNW